MVQRPMRGKQDARRVRAHVLAVMAILAGVGALLAFRAAYVDARAWGAACAEAGPAWPCLPREALLWLQYWSLWGLGALALGLCAFLTGWLPVAAASVALGAMAVANYNATWGVLGAALGVWAWIRTGRGVSGIAG